WGIRDFQSLAALPEIPLMERLGQPGLHFQRLARGEVQRELRPAEIPAAFRESMELEEPVVLLEPLGFILKRLLEQVMFRLREKSLATDHVQLELTLEWHPERQLRDDDSSTTVHSQFQRTIKLPVPSQEAKALLKLLQLDLNAHPPEAPVKKIALEAFPARLRSVVGTEDSVGRSRVGFPSVLDSHRPDSFQVLPAGFMSGGQEEIQASCQLALRFFRPALAAGVELCEGRPVTVAFHHIRARVLRAAGPWRVTGAWWEAGGEWRRDEWDLSLSL